MTNIEKVLETVGKEVGYREGINNSNKYGIWYGMNNVSWCCIFVSWVMHHSGISNDIFPKFASCTRAMQWAKKNKRFYEKSATPKVGDLILYDWDMSGDADHIGIIKAVNGTNITTIEGNTHVVYGDRDGVITKEVKKSSATIRGYIRPDYDNTDYLYPVLRYGSKHERVKYLQYRLNFCNDRLKFMGGKLNEDGVFGYNTLLAVKSFQRNRNINVDGIVGEVTWTNLNWQWGDLNLDGFSDTADALMILQSVVGKVHLTGSQKHCADMDGDGNVTSVDALKIMKNTVGK